MEWFSETLKFSTHEKTLRPITMDIADVIRRWKITTGMCFLFLPHTSASLVMCENYDPESKEDILNYYEQAVPENEPWYKHTMEGPDDSPSHIRTTLTHSSFSIPIDNGQLGIGIWQGIFLFEHRSIPHTRKLSVRCLKVN